MEAVRDGRLQGKDLDSAKRHHAACAECACEERKLAELGREISALPHIVRCPLTARRSRQALMAALNESVLKLAPPRVVRKTGFALALSASAMVAICFAVGHKRAIVASVDNVESIVEVHGAPRAVWSGQADREGERVNFSDGTAFFRVHPHARRRVIVQLPDGELEDRGTVFEVYVEQQHTRRISVTEGSVAVRLRGRSAFILGAGDTWKAEITAPVASSSSTTSCASSASSDSKPTSRTLAGSTSLPGANKARRTAERGGDALNGEAHAANKTPEPLETAADDAQAARAEDAAYVHIIELLAQAKSEEARAESKSYLLRFPSGFRRVEVLNIATRAATAAHDD
jgi:FecR-like protein